MNPVLYNFTEDEHTYLILDLRTLDVLYSDGEYIDNIKENIKEMLRFSNLQKCVVLDNLNNYKETM